MHLIIALLKINTTLAVCFLLYYLLLRKLTFYNLNRVFFLCTIALAMIMPFIDIQLKSTKTVPVILDISRTYTLPQTAAPSAFNVTGIVQAIFWTGVILMGLRLLVQLASVGMLYLRSRKEIVDGTAIRVMAEENNPFSFFKSIFINPGQLLSQELHMVLDHEKVHARQWHSADILLAELCKTFCWFNPIAWLIARAIKQNLEFIADREVLKNGTASKAYQYSLLRVSQSGKAVALTNNFNFSNLKTRIIMMNKKQSPFIQAARYFTAAPLTFALVCYFGVSMGQQQKQVDQKVLPAQSQQLKEAQFTVNSATAVATTKAAAPAGKIKSVHIVKEVQRNVPSAAAEQTTTTAAAGDIKSVRIVQTGDPANDAKARRIALARLDPAAIREALLDRPQDAAPQEAKGQPLVVIDGQNMPYSILTEINPNDIEAVAILKGDGAVKRYGEEAKHGAINIIMKKK